jgi:ABC-2 type transport system permease protein
VRSAGELIEGNDTDLGAHSMNVSVVWTIVRNELRRLSQERMLLVFGLGLPVVIIILIGSTFGSAGLHIGIIDQDGTARSAAIVARLEQRDGIDVTHHDQTKVLRRDVRATAIDIGVIVPKGYAADLARGHAHVEVVADASSKGLASALAAVQSAVDQEGIHEGAVRIVADGSPGLGDAGARGQVTATASTLHPVEVREVSTHENAGDIGTFSYTAPSNLVLFVFINTFAVSTALAIERQEGRIRRILATPNKASAVVAGIGVSRFAFAVAQSVLIVGVGRLLFGVRWGDPVGAALVVLLFAALSAAVGLIFGAVVQNADQANSIGIPLGVAMGMLGGCMWPLGIVPKAMRVVGHVVPQAWAMDAWQKLIFDGTGVGGIAVELAVLGGATVVLSFFAVRLLARSVTR